VKSRPAFGAHLRASRLGFHWSNQHEAYIRMSTPPGQDDILVEVAPADPTKLEDGPCREHRVWWESNAEQILDMCEPLRLVKAPADAFSFWVNDAGKEASHG